MKKWLCILINSLSFVIPLLFTIVFALIPGVNTLALFFLDITVATFLNLVPYFVFKYLRDKVIGLILGIASSILLIALCIVHAIVVSDYFDLLKDASIFLLAFVPCGLFCSIFGYFFYLIFGGKIGSVFESISNVFIIIVSYLLSLPMALLGKKSFFVIEILPLIVLLLFLVPFSIIHRIRRYRRALNERIEYERWYSSLTPQQRARYDEERRRQSEEFKRKWNEEREEELERNRKRDQELEESRKFHESLKDPEYEDEWGNKYTWVNDSQHGYREGNKQGYFKSNNVNHFGEKFKIKGGVITSYHEDDEDD